VHEACRAAAALLAGDRGLNTIEQPFSLQKEERAFYVLYSQMFAKEAARMTREQVLMLKPEIRWLVESFGNLLDVEASVEQALNDCEDVESEVTSLFDEIDILATPATIDASFDAEIRYPVEAMGACRRTNVSMTFLRGRCLRASSLRLLALRWSCLLGSYSMGDRSAFSSSAPEARICVCSRLRRHWKLPFGLACGAAAP